MQQFDAQVLIQVSLEDCLKMWLASDYYPHFQLAELPKLPQTWSSSDAWGENHISGSRHVDWSLASYPGALQQQINWRVQNYIKGCLVQYVGVITFEPQRAGQQTKVVMQMHWNDLEDHIEVPHPDTILQSILEAFKVLVEKMNFIPELKIAV